MIPREYLKKIRTIEIRTWRLAQDLLAGAYHSAFKGRGMDFEEVREYQAGDDVRTIDWNVTARTGITHIKKYREERELSIVLLVDISASGIVGSGEQSKRDLAAEIASVIAFSANRSGDRIGLILFTDEVELYIPARKGPSHIFRIIREVLYFEPQRRGTSCRAALQFLLHVFPKTAIVFVLSDFLDEGYDRALKVANQKHDVIPVHVSDPHEAELPDIGWIGFDDAENDAFVEINTGSRAVRDRYARQAEERLASCRRRFQQAGIDMVEVQTGNPYIIPLQKYFEMRRQRR